MNTTRQDKTGKQLKVFIKSNIKDLQQGQNLVMNSDPQAKATIKTSNFEQMAINKNCKMEKIYILLSKWLVNKNSKMEKKEEFLW